MCGILCGSVLIDVWDMTYVDTVIDVWDMTYVDLLEQALNTPAQPLFSVRRDGTEIAIVV